MQIKILNIRTVICMPGKIIETIRDKAYKTKEKENQEILLTLKPKQFT